MAPFMDYALRKSKEMRAQRFRVFEDLIDPLPRPIRILDLGGTNAFWERAGWTDRDDIRITSLNLAPDEKVYEHIEPVEGDATDLSRYEDDAFDVTFSNSVIEHVFTWENQVKMANEMRRVGRAHWCQTPNFWFPMEPHFHFPGWQWLPVGVRVAILRRRRCGFRPKTPDKAAARTSVEEVRLVSKREMKKLFPGSTLFAERFAGLVKSWTVHDGFPGRDGA